MDWAALNEYHLTIVSDGSFKPSWHTMQAMEAYGFTFRNEIRRRSDAWVPMP